MYNRHGFAQHGAAHGRRNHPFMQSHFRAPVNVYKTENSYELLVFAPGRVKENFSVKAQGTSLQFLTLRLKVYQHLNGLKKNTAAVVLKENLPLMKA